MTGIEWTDETWNPVVGCTVVSPGCTNCYAMRQAARLLDKPGSHYEGTTEKVNGKAVWTGKVALAPEHILTAPLHWKEQSRVFVNSMGDLFHEDVPSEWVERVFDVMLQTDHSYQGEYTLNTCPIFRQTRQAFARRACPRRRGRRRRNGLS